jgi:hypothetical protein
MKVGMVGINNFNKGNMKKIFAFLILLVVMASCYDEYVKDFDYNTVCFPYQIDVRTFVVGEGMEIEIGTVLGGVIKNTIDRNVDFVLENSLVTPERLTTMKAGASYIKNAVAEVTTLSPLPANYYTLSNSSRMIIKAGQHMGSVVMKADSAVFLTDEATINAAYAIPLYITKADADSIIEPKRFTVIGLKYENMLFGTYYHGGVTVEKDASGAVINTIPYYTTIPQPTAKTRTLTTIAPNALAIKGYSNNSTAKNELVLTLDGNNIAVSSATGSTFTYLPDGASTFNRPKLLQDRKIYLSYKYENAAGNTCYAKDTLTFRNRIRDGVNEWQDEDPLHY